MPRSSGYERQLARRQRREPQALLVELWCSTFRNIMPKAQHGAKGCSLLGIVQCDAMPTIDTQWFTDRLAERKMSGRQLAKLMGIDSSAVSLMFRGKRKMTLEEAAQIAVLLQSSTQEVLEAAGIQVSSSNTAKVIGFADGDGNVTLIADGTHDTVDAPPSMPGDCVAVQCRTANTLMAPWDGWMLFMSQAQVTPDKALGHLAMVAIKNNGLKVANVRRGYARGTYNLTEPNGKATQNVELAWASSILWIKTTA